MVYIFQLGAVELVYKITLIYVFVTTTFSGKDNYITILILDVNGINHTAQPIRSTSNGHLS